MIITLHEIEQAINYWRVQRPSRGEERELSPEVNVLAEVYALMIFQGVPRCDNIGPDAEALLAAARVSREP